MLTKLIKDMKSQRQQQSVLFLALFFVLFSSFNIFAARMPQNAKDRLGFDLPVRLWAYADVTWLSHCQYHVHMYLEIKNDDKIEPVILKKLTADTWLGLKPMTYNRLWYPKPPEEYIIPPNSKRIVAERSFYVNPDGRKSYKIRWFKFRAYTDRGKFESNFLSTPFSNNISENAIWLPNPAPTSKKLPDPEE